MIPLSITFLNPKILDFLLFLYEKQPDLGSEMWEIKIQKIVVNLLEKLRKHTWTERLSRNSWPSLSNRKL